jgi:signal transduction histidine kinase
MRLESDSEVARTGYGGAVRERLRIDGSTIADGGLALLLFAVGLWELLATPFADDVVRGPLLLNLATVVLMSVPLAARRLTPLAVAAAVFGAIAVRSLVAAPLEIIPSFLAALIAAYSVGAYSTRWRSVLGLTLAVGAIELAAAAGSGGEASPDPLAAPLFLVAVWAVGRVAGSRNANARAIERRAAERDRLRHEEARVAVAAERRRISRELHDVVSHSLAMIAMQAAGAQGVLHRQPQRAEESLRSIEQAAREGLTEMRRLLGLMGEQHDEVGRSPQPGIAKVQTLIERARDAGLDVVFDCEGEMRPVALAVDLSAYRIVQEALTNAAKHAGRCHAAVTLRWQQRALELEIINDGTLPSSDHEHPPGRGLIGMRERAAVVGGRLEVGRGENGYFRVWARLPLEQVS